MQCYVGDGRILTIVAPAALTSGVPYLLNSSVLIVPQTTAASGDTVAVVREGVFNLTKASGAMTLGAKLYWDDTAKNITTTSTSNTFVGLCTTAAASGDTTVEIYLHGNPV